MKVINEEIIEKITSMRDPGWTILDTSCSLDCRNGCWFWSRRRAVYFVFLPVGKGPSRNDVELTAWMKKNFPEYLL